jgi:hypothetical protein
MKRALVLLLTVCALAGCDLLTGDFRLSGTIDVAPRLRERAPKQNAMLFVVAQNSGGVPVALLRIVNPEFPASFEMGTADLLVPAVRRREPLTVRAMLNTHGDIGAAHPGDLGGAAAGIVAPGDSGISVILDHMK